MTPTEQTALNKQLLRETLAGYAAAAEVIEQERVERLRRMSSHESWAIFVGLVEGGKGFLGDPATLDVFEPERVANLLFVRRTLDKLSYAQGLR